MSSGAEQERSVLQPLPPLPAMESIALPGDGPRAHAGISLRDLEQGVKLPELRNGPEKYQVLRVLGEGGMGKVLLVYDRDLRRRVALKLIREATPLKEKRFLEEAQVLAQLEHPNIVPLYEIGLTGRSLYYTMRYLRGQTLREVLDSLRAGEVRAQRAYTLTRLVQIFQQIAQALAYAHAKGVVHRDLKPSNVMLGEHGEVQVLDWGLSKVVVRGEVETDPHLPLTHQGHLVGTPCYMAPEQALGNPIDARTDVYALGVMLYELLSLHLPFEGEPARVLAALLRDEPVPLRTKAAGRHVPAELEAVCLRAMKKQREHRYASAQALIEDVQSWLEAEADRARRHQKAEQKFAEGKRRLEEHQRLRGEVLRLAAESELQRQRFRQQQSVREKLAIFEAEQRAAEAGQRLLRNGSRAIASFTEALGFEPAHRGAREALADYYWTRFREAEERADPANQELFHELVVAYHDGKYDVELRGTGSLALGSDPPGAEVLLHTLVEEDLELVPREERRLGQTPLAEIPLPMGSYLVLLRKPGYAEVRYPVWISRNRRWADEVKLRTEAEIGADFVLVPGGPFVQGGDDAIRNWCRPRSEPRVGDFVLARFPVTMAEYIEFLNDVARTDPERAARHAPRITGEAESFLVRTDGLYRLQEPGAGKGPSFGPRHPIVGISLCDASSYCAWRSRQEGRTLRLPSEDEWEKAARGVDGRLFPWGNRFDPSLCNMIDSRAEPALAPVDEFPSDVSVYGVRGLGGNVADWTDPRPTSPFEARAASESHIVKGGAWYLKDMCVRCASRMWAAPAGTVDVGVGFRVARSLE